jgi:PEP-CTERM motif
MCPQFDGTLGTLTSMSIELDGSIMGSITLTNSDSTSSQTGSGTTSSQFFGPAVLVGFTIPSPMFTASFTTGIQTLGPSATETFPGLSGSGTATVTNTTSFVPYIGLGTFSFPVSTLSGLLISGGGGNFGGAQSTMATAKAEVTYVYSAGTVPEPATTMLAGGALLFLGLSSRRLSRRGFMKQNK